jgi:hypothetical protein
MVTKEGARQPLPRTEVQVVAAEDATRRGLVGRPQSREFGEGQDGTTLVSDLLTEAQRQGAVAVSDIGVTLISQGPEGPLGCRTSILPETVAESRTIPAGTTMVPVQKPVSRLVTESEYRCHMVSHPETRSVTESHQSCQSVSHPVTRTRTTYSYQYDSFTHSSRSVPRTESYTTYESRYECRSEPRSVTRTEYVSRNECHMEPVTHTVTRYEFQYETRYVPPRLETITHHRLHESEPACEALVPPAGAPGAPAPPLPSNRIEATFYFRP